MASPKPSRTISAEFLFWLQNRNPGSKAKQDSPLVKIQKRNPKIHESISDFADLTGEINTDILYRGEPGVPKQKKPDFLFFLPFEGNQ